VHEGTVGVSSTEGVGTTFRVELPVRPRAEAGRSGAEPQVEAPRR
jgi:signal transduction histidine kinase